MPLSLLDEKETHFTLHDGNESFPVAKYGLDETQMQKIRGLPQGYYDGGTVAPVVETPMYDPTGLYGGSADIATSQPLTIAQPYPGVPSSYELGGIAAEPILTGRDVLARQNLAADQAIGRKAIDDEARKLEEFNAAKAKQDELISKFNLSPADAARLAPLPSAAPSLGLTSTPTPSLDAMAGAQPAAPGYLGYMDQMMGQGMKQPSYELPSEYAQGYQQMIDASKQQAQASADAAAEQARIYDQQVKEIQLAEVARQTQERAVQQDLDKIRNDIATQKIDPTRVWSNMSTGNRVLAGISIFLGGVAGGMQGTENRALKIINDAIDKDIDSQKSELGKKQNLLAINLQKYRNIQDAAAATKAQLMAVTQAQVQSAAAKAGSKQALAAAQMFQGQTELEMGKLKMQLAASQMTQNKLMDPRGMSPKEAMQMNQEIQDKLVQLPNGQYYPAFNKESAVKVREAQAKLMPIKALMTEASNFMDQGYTLPVTQRNTEAKRLKANILVELKNLKELGQLTEADMDIINPLVPQLGDILFQGKDRDAIASINRQLDNKLNATYSAYLPGLNPAGRQTRETSVFGGR